jgi:hypothetical protein
LVAVETRVHHTKCGPGEVYKINHQKKTCQIAFNSGWLEDYSFADIEKDGGFKFLVWMQMTVSK